LIGPGGFNNDAIDGWLPPVDAYNAVNEMILDVSRQMRVPVINATEIMAHQDGKVYEPRSNLWSAYGHQVMAREIEYAIAEQIRALSSNQVDEA